MDHTAAQPQQTNGHARTWLAAAAVLALMPQALPITFVAAMLYTMPAALWWLSTTSTAGSDSSSSSDSSDSRNRKAEWQDDQQCTNSMAPVKDENLDLSPPHTESRNSIVTRKASSTVQTPRKTQQPLTNTLTNAASRPGVTFSPAAAAALTKNAETIAVVEIGNNSALSKEEAVKLTNPLARVAMPVAGADADFQDIQPAATAGASEQQQQQQSEAPVALTGSAAILAKIRAQRQSSAASSRPSSATATAAAAGAVTTTAKAPAKVMVVYASQTGTGQEIARTIHAECTQQSIPADVMSMNELGFSNLTADKTPVVVVVASSTGDGDPPDNAAAAYVALKKQQPAGRLAGIKYTVLGLGDSNYTRFMHVPRAIKTRFQELGAECFYKCAEADEVDGLEATVDPWCEGITAVLKTTLQQLNNPQQDSGNSNSTSAAAGAAAAVPSSAVAAAGAVPSSVDVSRQGSVLSAVSMEPSNALLAAVMQDSTESAAASPAGLAQPRVRMELSGSSSAMSGQASLLGEDSSISQLAAAAPPSAAAAAVSRPAPEAAVAAAAAAGPPPATPPVKLVNGLAPAGVDLKGAPPLAPCRIALNLQVAASVAEAAAAKELSWPTAEQLGHRDATGCYSAAAPFWAKVSDARLMTADWSDRTVIHMELDLSDSGMQYGAGDAVGVLAQNDPELVAGLLARLGVPGDQVFEVQAASGTGSAAVSPGSLLAHIPWPCSMRHAFTHGTDLTSIPRKSLLRLLAEHCADEDEKRTLLFLTSRAGREAYAEEITAGQPSLLDLLNRFLSCKPPVDALLDALPPLAPRMYSLTNAPVSGVPGACGASKLQYAFSVVQFETKYGTRKGVATSWLAQLCKPWLAGKGELQCPEVCVPIFLRKAVDFKPPSSLDVPVMMIGPGTGVAPFRGFLQQRLADIKAADGNSTAAPATLYFGCRRPDEDYLYEQDWQELARAGALQTLRVAFSRQQADVKVYVQHLMKEDAGALAALMAAGGHVYVCGDGAQMAKDVHALLLRVLRDERGLSEGEAADELTAMAKAGRYVRDIWS